MRRLFALLAGSPRIVASKSQCIDTPGGLLSLLEGFRKVGGRSCTQNLATIDSVHLGLAFPGLTTIGVSATGADADRYGFGCEIRHALLM